MKAHYGAGKIVEQLRIPTALAEHLGLVPNTHMVPVTSVPGNPMSSSSLSWYLNTHGTHGCTQTHTYTHKQIFKKKKRRKSTPKM